MDIACKEYLGECDKFTNKHHKDSNPLNNNPLELERIQLLETYKYISFLYNNFGEKMKLGQNGFSIGIYNRYVTKYNKKFNSHAVMWKVIQKKYFNTTDKLLEWYKKYIPDLVEKHTSKEILEQQKAEFKRNLFQKRMK